MKPRATRAFAPATIANLGSGFDVLGLSLERPGDFAVARRTAGSGLEFSMVTDVDGIPADAARNVAAHVAALLIDEARPPFGIDLVLEKRMPVSSGLGSSAASSVAAIMAVNAVLARPLPRQNLLRFAIEGERLACGTAHADNVAPSLLGGVCLVLKDDPVEIVPLPVVNRIVWVVVHPHCEVLTKDARGLIPAQIPTATAVRQWACVGGLTAALATGNAKLAGRSIEDRVAEPVRSALIPGFEAVRAAAVAAGATGCTLSGSGPSMFAVTSSLPVARKVAAAMVRAFRRAAGIAADAIISRINMEGARVVWRKDA